MLFSTGIMTILTIVYCRFLEKRSLYSMGFTREKMLRDYGLGLVLGFVMFGACVLIAWAGGTLKYNGYIIGNGWLMLFAFFIGFVIQGMAEEVFLRGYLMISIASRNSIALAVFVNSILFALLHIFNSGISVLAVINLALFGVFASLYTLKANSIWGISAIHSIWNFTQGNIFGIKVSGMDSPVSLFSFVPTGEGTLLNGGDFGLEGGLAVTIVLCISIIAVLLVKGRGVQPIQEPVEEAA
jgi:membrane protease YdiL (CAAX protease family)